MARYWVFLNNEVAGPFGVDQLIRLRGFSRQTQVCVDEAGNTPKNWISPAEIPELAHIFKAVDEHLSEPPAPKPVAKPPTIRYPKPFVPAVTLKAPRFNFAQIGGWVLLAAVLAGGGAFGWSLYSHHDLDSGEKESARGLIENVHLPPPSPFATLPQYFQEKNVKPRWDFEKVQDALYHVTLTCYAPSLVVYAFEVNLQAQTVRGLNSAASQLLSEGFPAPPSRKPKAAPPVKKSPAESFASTLDQSRAAVEAGDFQSVWNLFSQRKKSEMARAGMSQDGFVRLQGLTHRVESATKQQILKTKQNSDTEMLVLIKQTQEGRPDVFIKQMWTYENESWKLDDEQKRGAGQRPAPEASDSKPASPSDGTTATPQANPPKPAPTSLPGMSN